MVALTTLVKAQQTLVQDLRTRRLADMNRSSINSIKIGLNFGNETISVERLA